MRKRNAPPRNGALRGNANGRHSIWNARVSFEEKTSNPGRRAALEAALAEIDARIQSLG